MSAKHMEPRQESLERPILFSAPMVRAILDGRKSQTRRVLNPMCEIPDARAWREETVAGVSYAEPGYWVANVPDKYGDSDSVYTGRAHCPYGVPGARLWVRETWTHTGTGVWKVSDAQQALDGKVLYAATDNAPCSGCWFPSIYMPRWASRITLEITEVRVQRVQEISEEDCIAEGVLPLTCSGNGKRLSDKWAPELFARLWDSINAKRGFGWDVNPWVWALTFKLIPAPSMIDARAAIAEAERSPHA